MLYQLLLELSEQNLGKILSQLLHMHSSSTANILHTSENVKTQPDQVIFGVFPQI